MVAEKKIGVVCCSESWGGMEMLAVKQAVMLTQKGHSVYFIGKPGSPAVNEAVKANLQVITVDIKGYIDIHALTEFYKIFRTVCFDIVHTHYSKDLWSVVPSLGLTRNRAGLVLTKHIGTQKPKRDFLHKKIYNRVDAVIAISKVIEKNILETHPLSKDKVVLIPNGIDTTIFYPGRCTKVKKRYGIPESSFVIGIAGRLSWWKGYREFLLMARNVTNQNPDIMFLVVGGATIGEEREAEEIKEFCKSLGIENRVVFAGFQSDTAEFYRAMDLFVYPAYAEAFGLVIIEAMAAGLPVVASDSDGIPEIVINGETGILVPPRDSDKLTDAVLSLLQESKKMGKFKNNARSRVEKYFSSNKMISDVEKLYDKIIHDRIKI